MVNRVKEVNSPPYVKMTTSPPPFFPCLLLCFQVSPSVGDQAGVPIAPLLQLLYVLANSREDNTVKSYYSVHQQWASWGTHHGIPLHFSPI